jgi:hypothetical protein
MEKDNTSKRNATPNNLKAREQKFGAPNQEEIRRMERLLNKIKEA